MKSQESIYIYPWLKFQEKTSLKLEIRESQNLAKFWGGWPIVSKEWKAGRELEAPM